MTQGAFWVGLAFALALAALVAIAVGVWRGTFAASRPDWVIRDQLKSQILVTMDDGTGFRGALEHADRMSLTMLGAYQLSVSQEAPVKANGRMILPRAKIAYIQQI